VATYVDAGHSAWQPADVMAARLRSVGISRAQGFSLNVSNFRPTGEGIAYGQALAELIGGRHFVIDTSRSVPKRLVRLRPSSRQRTT
jgi:endoglucanase